jgi:hypothetical protein
VGAKSPPSRSRRHGQTDASALARVADRLSPPRRRAVFVSALAAAYRIDDHDRLISAYAALARAEPGAPRLAQIVADARGVADPRLRLAVLQEVAAHVPGPLSAELLGEALRIIEAEPHEYGQALNLLTPDLPRILVPRALDVITELESLDSVRIFSTLSLAGLAEHLPSHLLEVAARRILGTFRPNVILKKLPPLIERMSVDQCLGLVDWVNETYNELGAAPYYAMLTGHLPASLGRTLADSAHRHAIAFDDLTWRVQVLTLLLPSLPESRRRTALGEALATARRIPQPSDRFRALADLVPYLPGESKPKVLREALDAAAGSSFPGPLDPMIEVARVATAETREGWPLCWRDTMRTAATQGRAEMAKGIRAALDVIERDGTDEAVVGVLQALDDVVRWWP